ncbi:hypothetical protein WG66_014857 [Moniliophthora roreri]|uniref:DUF7918 domain-containing protein n=1 Tax=Moniliophthora roreri TaxID=221103 RepID=A0A0W0G7T6_MONRR|nr:hypothetical protein WG66_014857 [Moniliophthora roreri]
MVSINNLSSWIYIEGVEAQLYDVQIDQARNQVSCWVASEAGKKYEVEYQDDAYTNPSSWTLSIDGFKRASGVVRESNNMFRNYFDGVVSSATSVIPFKFATVETTDDENADKSDNPHIGEIKLTVYRTEKVGDDVPWTARVARPIEPQPFHETTKKGLHHQTTFTDSVDIASRIVSVNFRNIGEPIAIFIFRYRPLTILQANGIAPRASPERVAGPSNSNKRRAPTEAEEEDVKFSLSEASDGDSFDKEIEELQKLQAS